MKKQHWATPSLPPVPDHRVIPALGFAVLDSLRDKPPVMVIDKVPGIRNRSLPAHDAEAVRVTAHDHVGPRGTSSTQPIL